MAYDRKLIYGLLGDNYMDPMQGGLLGAARAASQFAGPQNRPVSMGQMIGQIGGAYGQGVQGAKRQNLAMAGQAQGLRAGQQGMDQNAIKMQQIQAQMAAAAKQAKIAESQRAALGQYAEQLGLPKNTPHDVIMEALKDQNARSLAEHKQSIKPPFAGAVKDEDGNWTAGEAYQASREAIARASAAASVTARQGGLTLTPAQKAVDKRYAGEFVDWVQKDSANAEKGLTQLQGALNILNSGRNVTGPGIGLTPDRILTMTNQEALTVKNDVAEVVQKNLRLILGSQFTEKEGALLLKRAFDPGLDEKINARRIKRLIRAMRASANEKARMSEYYQAKGTLLGFTASKPDLSGLLEDGPEPQPGFEE